MPPVQDELHAWLALAGGSLAARQRSRQLLKHFGGPLEVFHAGRTQAEAALGGLPCGSLFSAAGQWAETAERTQQWLAQSPRHHCITLADQAYPAALLNTADPPLVLHAIGELESLRQPAVAIVGSRYATPAGTKTAHDLAAELSSLGVAVVSGLAVGIDAAAHRACLAGHGPGTTIAVVANGLDDIYPRGHEGLARQLTQSGILLSEHPLGTPALPAYFPQRNRIIAGLGLITVVVEATLRSGSLITARLALEAGRDVFAVPGHLSSPQSAGCNALIKAGAGLVESAVDLLDALPWAFPQFVQTDLRSGHTVGVRRKRQTHSNSEAGFSRPPRQGPTVRNGATSAAQAGDAEIGATVDLPSVALDGDALSAAAWTKARRLLRARPCDLAELATAAGAPPSEMSRTLLLAELDGLVGRLPGGLFQWCGPPV